MLHIKHKLMAVALNDAELVRQIRSGTDRRAEAELFRRMAARIGPLARENFQGKDARNQRAPV